MKALRAEEISMTTPIYRFIALDPRRDVSQLSPDEWALTLGVEVTVPVLADACGRGSIDPQHGCSRGAVWVAFDGHGQAAIGVARDVIEVPRAGLTLATIRRDVDSLGAMAVFVLRSIGLPGGAWSPDAWARIALIAERDAFVPGAAWAPRPLPTIANPWPMTAAPVSETKSLAPLGVICSPFRGQTELPLAERVAIVACWLLWGEPTSIVPSDHAPLCARRCWTREAEDYTIADQIAAACGVTTENGGTTDVGATLRSVYLDARARATAARLTLARAVESGEVKIRVMLDGPPVGGPYYEGDGTIITMHEYEAEHSYTGRLAKVAVVESAHVGAMGLGYCVAPVVVAMMPGEEHARKVTIAAWRPGLVDFAALRERLNEAEVVELGQMGLDHGTGTQGQRVREGGWGGGATILGSPQGDGTVLSLNELARLVRASMVSAA